MKIDILYDFSILRLYKYNVTITLIAMNQSFFSTIKNKKKKKKLNLK